MIDCKHNEEINLVEKPSSQNRFLLFVERTLRMEGSWSDDGSDPGGATMFGLSSRFNPEVADEIKSRTLSKTKALSIIKQKYYDPIVGVNDVPIGIAFIIFDSRFHGMKEAIIQIQSDLNKYRGARLTVDGKWGRSTATACIGLKPSEVEEMLARQKNKAYQMAVGASQRVLSYQKQNGLPLKDYTNGFYNRQTLRAGYANEVNSYYA
jgi:lysozyme family protein